MREVSFSLERGEILGVVGESGCGKSLCNLAIMDLLDKNAKSRAEQMSFDGENLLTMSAPKRRSLRGRKMAMIFQDPLSSLNPSLTIETQILETLAAGEIGESGHPRRHHKEEIKKLLSQVGIPDAAKRMKSYPHQLSGGMCQRVMIAQAIANRPTLLIADEPTTALDVTIQSQILDLLLSLREQNNMSILFVTHDIGVVANVSDRIQVMYAGEIVESQKTSDLIQRPKHPYTEALFKSLPQSQEKSQEKNQRPKLYNLPGLVPDLLHPPEGCLFHPRCPYQKERCQKDSPKLTSTHRCFYPLGEGGSP